MTASRSFLPNPIKTRTSPLQHTPSQSFQLSGPILKRVSEFRGSTTSVATVGRFPTSICMASNSESTISSAAEKSSPSFTTTSHAGSHVGVSREFSGRQQQQQQLEAIEENVEKAIYRCRFMAILGVFGSLIGSVLCFIKGCTHVVQSYVEYFVNRSQGILLLVEAIDVYLLGTVMLVFGMGLYELFVSNLGSASSPSDEKASYGSNFFGLFTLKERPKWLDITTVNELKTKLGHVIVMLLLIGLFEKSKKAIIQTPLDLLCFCASVLLSSSCLFLLSKLNDSK